MTNTLHRSGEPESFRDDYVIIAVPCRGKNDEGAIEKLKAFLRICARHEPANLGNSSFGSVRPSRSLGPSVHWRRNSALDFESVIEGVEKARTVAAVFGSSEKAAACLQEVIEADLGLSINVSTSVEGAKALAEQCGIKRHSVEYSLGFWDPKGNLPNPQVLELSTMCGHSMVSSHLVQKLLQRMREGRYSSRQAAVTLARFCPCGVFNPTRARRLLEEARGGRSSVRSVKVEVDN